MANHVDGGAEMKTCLKILVDVETNKVVFAEAGKDFVDFLFQVMSIPVSTVIKLLNELGSVGSVGSLGALYRSIEALNAQYYEPTSKKDTILKPRVCTTVPLLSLNEYPTVITYYKCRSHPSQLSDQKGGLCSNCGRYSISEETSFGYVGPKPPLSPAEFGYVKQGVPYIVMDNLEVKPMSVSLIMSLVKDFDSLVEKDVQVGRLEGLAIMKALFENQAVLTSVFLPPKKV